MAQLSVFAGANLPSVTELATALAELNPMQKSGGVFLKMDKGGHWIMGADQEEIGPDEEFAVNPFSFIHGYVAWEQVDEKSPPKLHKEIMVPITKPLPETPATPATVQRGWEFQIGVSLKPMDSDLEIKYCTKSTGGKKAVQALAAAVIAQIEKDQTRPVPIVKLTTSKYKHKNASYGMIYVPVFEIVRFVGLNGEDETAALPAPTQTPRRRA